MSSYTKSSNISGVYESNGYRSNQDQSDSILTRSIWNISSDSNTSESHKHIEQRLGFFHQHGYLEELPTSWQVRIGTLAMLPVSLSESERERERSRQTWLGQVPIRVPLQVVYCPAQFFVDSGLTMKPKNIVKHLLSVYHEDAFIGYDLQLLHSHSEGLELLQEKHNVL